MSLTTSDKSSKRSDKEMSDFLDGGAMQSVSYLGDISYILSDVTNIFEPTREDNLISVDDCRYEDGLVYVSIVLPESLLKSFMDMLESLKCFFKFISCRSKISKAYKKSIVDPEADKQRAEYASAFEASVLSIYDALINDGVSIKKAISWTNREMKKKGHPWASYNSVLDTLRSAGRFRTKDLYKKREKDEGK